MNYQKKLKILRLRRSGYRLWSIAHETGVAEHVVAALLVKERLAIWAVFERKGETR